ncbi:folylpolyglutamate synthase/dihydrofolate synthase family protein [Neobacillus sp. DY30]|uniref:bifunctional folylpolyglutamate synthase/dihydrofolate synthase n=1 Tax=Neobacillus sp. DY30 TaxID=3047871 RepID=UPI0024C06BEB|nr:folylpolyglutamate synthase/dihydrofolate synthase family protein [Neobacillus sp. DY30]WHX99496.1 folylpolyglutamate synthase/dihydrofolate synthase family protein [Neobacillus sp. DY30]
MFTTYNEALEWIHGRLRLGIKPGLARMEWMMEKLGSPELKMKTVHIGGTNGKGSTVTFLRSILEAAGYSVGTFTSPYIEQFNERISVNGKPISDKEILELTNVIVPLADELEETELGGPTEFEVITAMSFYYFANINQVDIVLYEVGLGGRFDSTNVIQPIASVITNIGLDHTNILGHTYEDIAFEKAGIIKEQIPIFTAVKNQNALKIIKEQAANKHAPIFILNQDFSITAHRSRETGEMFTLSSANFVFEQLEINMIGQHQTENAALSVMASQYINQHEEFSISENAIKTGLKKAYWPGRFEILSKSPLVVVDGAHNDEGISALTHELSNRYSNYNIHIIFAALKDKKLDKMISQLDQVADEITFVSFDFPRAAEAMDLFSLSNSKHKSISENWQAYLAKSIQNQEQDSVLIITGSLYFISEVKLYLSEFLKNNTISL